MRLSMKLQNRKTVKNIFVGLVWFLIIPVCVAELKTQIPQSWKDLKSDLKSRRSALISSVMSKRLQRISRAMNRKNSEDRALELIEKLEKASKDRPTDLMRAYYLKAQVYSGKDDFKNALLFYKKAMDLKRLSYDEHLSALYDIASLHVFQGKINQASRLVDQWFYLADKVTAAAYMLKASILVEKKQQKEALKLVMKAIEESDRPIENWLAFASSLHLELGNYVQAAQMLEKLVASYPDRKKYWTSLSASYLNIKKNNRAVASLDLAYKLDFLSKETEIVHLSSLLFHQGQPLKAANLLQQALEENKIKKNQKNYEMLGDSWRGAEEDKKALRNYQLASQYSEDGKIFTKIGYIHLNNENWIETVGSFKEALKKGGVRKPEQVYIQMGVALFQLKQYAESIKSFEQVLARETDSQWIRMAREWIDHTSEYM